MKWYVWVLAFWPLTVGMIIVFVDHFRTMYEWKHAKKIKDLTPEERRGVTKWILYGE